MVVIGKYLLFGKFFEISIRVPIYDIEIHVGYDKFTEK